MADFSGRKVRYGIGRETTSGTAVTPSYWLRWETADFDDKATTILNQSAMGVLDKYSGAEIVQTWGEGQIAGKVTDQGFGEILYGALDTYSRTTHAGETTVFDHTYSESQANTPGTVTIVRLDPNKGQSFAQATLNTFELDVKAGDFVRHTSSFIAQPSTSVAEASTFVAENEFKAKYVVAKFAALKSGLAGATAIPVQSCKLRINKNVAPFWIVGQNNPSNIYSQAVEVTGELVLRYTDATYYALRFNNTIQAASVTVTNTDVTVGSTTNPSFSFTIPQLYVNDWKAENTLDGMVLQTVTFTAMYSLTDGFAIQGKLTNTVNNYNPLVS